MQTEGYGLILCLAMGRSVAGSGCFPTVCLVTKIRSYAATTVCFGCAIAHSKALGDFIYIVPVSIFR